MSTYIYKNDQQLGPYEDEEIMRRLNSGQFSINDFCWKSGWSDWKKLKEVYELRTVPPPPPKITQSSNEDEAPITEKPSIAGGGITKEAAALVEKLNQSGSALPYINTNTARVLRENGIEVSNQTTPEEAIAALKAKDKLFKSSFNKENILEKNNIAEHKSDTHANNNFSKVTIPNTQPPELHTPNSKEDDIIKNNEEELLKLFVGNKFNYYKNKWRAAEENKTNISLNWAAFFCPLYWIGYRKLYKESGILMLSLSLYEIAAGVFQYLHRIDNVIPFLLGLVYLLQANSIYKKHCLNKIRDISPQGDLSESIIYKLTSKGGVHILSGFACLFLGIALPYITSITTEEIIKNSHSISNGDKKLGNYSSRIKIKDFKNSQIDHPREPQYPQYTNTIYTNKTDAITNTFPSIIDSNTSYTAKNTDYLVEEYKKKVSNLVSSPWHYYVDEQQGLLTIGSLKVAFLVNAEGKVKNLHVVSSNSSNQHLMDCALRSVMDAKFPPMPPDLAATLPNGNMEIEYSFTIY